MNIIELGKLLKLARQQKGLTQDQMAETLSVTPSAISKWENGKNLPDSDMLLKLALALGLSIEDLYYPEKTIERLTNNITQITKTNVSNDLKKTNINTIKKTKNKSKSLQLIIIISIFIVICIITGFWYFYQKSQVLEIVPVTFRTTEDTYYGTVYEMGCIYDGALSNTTQLNNLLDVMTIAWKNDSFISNEIIYKKISIYKTVEDAQNWDAPIKSFYLVR